MVGRRTETEVMGSQVLAVDPRGHDSSEGLGCSPSGQTSLEGRDSHQSWGTH